MTRRTGSFGKWLAAAAVAGLIVVLPAAAADFTLRLVSETNSKITLGWDARQNVVNYTFYANGQRVSNTYDGSRTQVTFGKVNCTVTPCYKVQALVNDGVGGYPVVTPPPPPAACADGQDNDGDGKVDLADPGCSSASDNDETDPVAPKPACSDTVDNDGDGKIDYPADPGCTSATDTDETDQVSPPPTTITGSQCTSRASVANAIIENVTVTGNCSMNANGVTIRNSTIQGAIEVVGANEKVIGSSANRVGYTSGADGLLLDGNVFDGHGTVKDGITMWGNAAGDPPRNWIFRNNTFKNFYVASDPSAHSQAIYNGYSTDGLIENNLFYNNGTTSHIFFTWWSESPNSNTTYPRNICVRGNTFQDGPNVFHYYAINFRAEIPTSANIVTDPNELGFSTTSPQFNGTC